MEIAGIVLFITFSVAGIAIIFLSMPGTFVILAGIFLYALMTGFNSVSWKLLLLFLLMSVFAESADNLLAMLGAKKSGASKSSTWAVLAGSIAGAFAGGIIAPVAGSIIGAFIGGAAAPFAVEYLKSKNLRHSMKAGMGSLAGRLGGMLLKFLIALIMIGMAAARIF